MMPKGMFVVLSALSVLTNLQWAQGKFNVGYTLKFGKLSWLYLRSSVFGDYISHNRIIIVVRDWIYQNTDFQCP